MTVASSASLSPRPCGGEDGLTVGEVVQVARGGPPQFVDDGQRNGRSGRPRLHGVDDHRQHGQRVGEGPVLQEFGDRGPDGHGRRSQHVERGRALRLDARGHLPMQIHVRLRPHAVHPHH